MNYNLKCPHCENSDDSMITHIYKDIYICEVCSKEFKDDTNEQEVPKLEQ